MTKYSKEAFAAECANDENDEDDALASFNTNGVNASAAVGGGAHSDQLSIVASVFPLNGRPFSATCRQILPRYFDEAEENFDEFGFRKIEANESDDPTRDDAMPIETSQQRIKWLALIQFTHEHVFRDELLWADVQIGRVTEAPKFAELLRAEGIPHSLRPFLWPRLSGASAIAKKRATPYTQIVRHAATCAEQAALIEPQIDKDLLRTLPTNYCFSRADRRGTMTLRRVLKAIAFIYPDLGYCQGMGVVVASLLLVCAEEDAFWVMCALIEDILPANYYTTSLLGVRADERIVNHLMQIHMPELTEVVKRSELNMSMITINWLITLLSSVFPMRVLLRVWDLIFAHGSVVIFRVIISMLKMNEEAILDKAVKSSRSLLMSDLFALIQQIPAGVANVDYLLEVVQSFDYSITAHYIRELRKKHQAILLADNGIICEGDANLPNQHVHRRRLSAGSKGIFHQFLHNAADENNGYEDNEDPRTKNIRQTEMVIGLRNAILQICQHFASCSAEEHAAPVSTQADYTRECDALDRERFLKAHREGRKRARALLDFERQDADELGFRRHQLITIVSERDEHCWVGELDGRRGWFPAKFVEVVDERGKNYCERGDEAVNERISELTRGALALTFRRILFHGIRRSNRISTFVSHPWPFIEALSGTLVERKNDGATRSRLTLCDTFKLDQDGKVLSPEELLFRAVQEVNQTHSAAGASLDARLRSLIAFALNEQCLHLWFDIFCNSKDRDALRIRYYHSWSFIRSPVAHQIKCELRLLSQFAFNLNVESELAAAWKSKNVLAGDGVGLFRGLRAPRANNGGRSAYGVGDVGSTLNSNSTPNLQAVASPMSTPSLNAGGFDAAAAIKSLTQLRPPSEKQPLKEGVRDMLIKHHLFSWDL